MDTQTLRFVLIAAVLYGLFHLAYHRIPDKTLQSVIYPNIIGHVAAKVINTFTPDRKVRVKDNKIMSSKAVLNIVRGCDGSGVWFMLMAAVLGFGGRIKHVVVGLVLGTLVVYTINQIRIVGLYYLVEWNRMYFPAVHTYYAPTLIIFLIAAFFLWWTRWSIQSSTESS
ncbi:MAG: exosortase family protein XrtM [Gammaproteobacteria bacterium]|nr:exosortase family protein XrtM [Gammaproteobacteria bacterium]NNL10620.1 exosortase family protein XrtM [Pseudomonadales bacterium]NNM10304.1 exosortase family protein XrtM [Pseudomonadales bacterium]